MEAGKAVPLRVLVVEDSADDCSLLLRELARGGYAVSHRRVDTPEGLLAAIDEQSWDIVFADFTMPRFIGTEALSLVRGRGLGVPFIFVSGTIGEDTAVAAMRAGAQDYIMKDNLKRLLPAVERELREAELRREQRRSEDERRKSEARFRNILTIAADAVIAVDEDQRITIFNRGAQQIFGYPEEEILGEPLERLLPERYRALHREHLRAFAASPENARRMNERGEVWGRRRDGSEFPAEASISKLNENGRTTFTVILRDVTERKRTEARLDYLAHYDALTGLPNRFLFMDRLRQAILEAARHEHLVAVASLDLDRFKTVNDSLGHEAGDVLLKAVAERLAGCVREGDTVARLAGDEFTLLLAGLGRTDHPARIAQQVLDSLARPFHIAGQDIFASASLGMTFYPLDDSDADALLRNADTTMHRAKERGGNAFEFYAAEMMSQARARLALENALRRALEHDELALHYQPVVDLRNGRVTGVEALVRWHHPERGLVPPDEFIPVAEETGFILPLGEWVLREACLQCRRWEREAGLAPMRLAVNVSPRQFQQSDFRQTVVRALDESGMEPQRLDLEITETLLMQHVGSTLRIMRELGELGVQFSIDDFGTGYSSLAYLKRLPIGRVKIDRSFVRDVPADANDATIVMAILSMSRSLGIPVIAEGVETREQLDFLRVSGCEAAQGYFFNRPLPAAELLPRLGADAPPPWQ